MILATPRLASYGSYARTCDNKKTTPQSRKNGCLAAERRHTKTKKTKNHQSEIVPASALLKGAIEPHVHRQTDKRRLPQAKTKTTYSSGCGETSVGMR
jgi:hypothetical protein